MLVRGGRARRGVRRGRRARGSRRCGGGARRCGRGGRRVARHRGRPRRGGRRGASLGRGRRCHARTGWRGSRCRTRTGLARVVRAAHPRAARHGGQHRGPIGSGWRRAARAWAVGAGASAWASYARGRGRRRRDRRARLLVVVDDHRRCDRGGRDHRDGARLRRQRARPGARDELRDPVGGRCAGAVAPAAQLASGSGTTAVAAARSVSPRAVHELAHGALAHAEFARHLALRRPLPRPAAAPRAGAPAARRAPTASPARPRAAPSSSAAARQRLGELRRSRSPPRAARSAPCCGRSGTATAAARGPRRRAAARSTPPGRPAGTASSARPSLR